MTVLDHPARSDAQARGDLAEAMVDKATDLALLVRDEGRESVLAFLGALGSDEKDALLVVLAAMMPVDGMSRDDLLAWVDFDEFGRPLKPPALPCGSFKAYRRHKRAGELVDDACQQAARVYWRDREKLRKPAARETSRAALPRADSAWLRVAPGDRLAAVAGPHVRGLLVLLAVVHVGARGDDRLHAAPARVGAVGVERGQSCPRRVLVVAVPPPPQACPEARRSQVARSPRCCRPHDEGTREAPPRVQAPAAGGIGMSDTPRIPLFLCLASVALYPWPGRVHMVCAEAGSVERSEIAATRGTA